ncbi:hypothetical protein, partial [Mesorhizobium sp. M1E.F.Ca.ET.063.01.1.1]|uniref:hypothetical protein n=1 Tax=Mesorhizobium sp. M1E.F.Ca.ET.063.01.1.1 TaxID=2496750 RepID=UPI001AECB534
CSRLGPGLLRGQRNNVQAKVPENHESLRRPPRLFKFRETARPTQCPRRSHDTMLLISAALR